MNLDLGSFAFGGNVATGGNTPSWGTALGQSRPDYKSRCRKYSNWNVVLFSTIGLC